MWSDKRGYGKGDPDAEPANAEQCWGSRSGYVRTESNWRSIPGEQSY